MFNIYKQNCICFEHYDEKPNQYYCNIFITGRLSLQNFAKNKNNE